MPETVVVRHAVAADAPELLRLVDALADYEKLDRPEPDARERLVRDAFGPEPRIRAYLAELDGRAVAYAITYDAYSSFLARPTLYLEDVFVDPAARRHGVGAAIFRRLAEAAVAGGYGRMEWSVLDWNELAIGFYEKIGARRLGEWYAYRLTADQLQEIARAEPAAG